MSNCFRRSSWNIKLVIYLLIQQIFIKHHYIIKHITTTKNATMRKKNALMWLYVLEGEIKDKKKRKK